MHKTNVIKAIAVMERGDAKYVRADIHEEILEKQSKAAIAGIDAAKLAASKMEREAKRLYAECNPAALESERKANAILTERIAELEQERDAMEKRALAYKAGPDGTCNKYFIRDWGHIRYIARPENNTELEEVSVTKVTVEHKGKAQPSIFYKGNIVTIWDGSVVLVTAGTASGTFSGVKLCPYLGTASDNFETENCKQFHGTLTLGSL